MLVLAPACSLSVGARCVCDVTHAPMHEVMWGFTVTSHPVVRRRYIRLRCDLDVLTLVNEYGRSVSDEDSSQSIVRDHQHHWWVADIQ
jgi:hypothetical protein